MKEMKYPFFVLDSDHLEETETRLYGYTFAGDHVVESEQELEGQEPAKDGAYVYVRRDGEQIHITQDFVGSFGLYLFRKGRYFALSNSFLQLVEYLKPKHKLTLNQEYTDYLLFVNLCSSALTETPAKEIISLDRSAVVTIDISRKDLQIRLVDYMENTVDPTTEEGIAILDAWQQKWISRIRNRAIMNGSIRADLSGGFDSRMVLALLLSSGVEMNGLHVFSNPNGLHTHTEDLRIATQIAEHYGFTLNHPERLYETVPNQLSDILRTSYYAKIGFHKQMYFICSRFVSSSCTFSGKGGECLRDYHLMNEDKYINSILNLSKIFNDIPKKELDRMRLSARKLLHRTFEELRGKYKSFGRPIVEDEISQYLYRETRCRNHFGKSQIEGYLSGGIPFSPLLDPDLSRLKLTSAGCEDHNLLSALIFNRYAPELLDFEFEGGRSIKPETVCFAKEVNQKYPNGMNRKTTDPISVRQIIRNGQDDNKRKYNKEKVDAVMLSVFCSEEFQTLFDKVYSRTVYRDICQTVKERPYHPMTVVFAAFAVGLILWERKPKETSGSSFIQYLLDHADQDAEWGTEVETLKTKLDEGKEGQQRKPRTLFDRLLSRGRQG